MGVAQVGLREGDQDGAFLSRVAKSILRISRDISRAASRLARSSRSFPNEKRATSLVRAWLRSRDCKLTAAYRAS
jgi:hypothetical protein